MPKICVHAIVIGKVQGVYFRKVTQQKALECDVTGWVKNLSDGTVELVACGEKDRVSEFIDWLWKGSPRSEVVNVEHQEIPYEDHVSFAVR